MAVLLALDLPLAQLFEDLPGRPRRLYFETSDPLDDIVVETDAGTVYVQAKRSPRFGASGPSNLAEVAHAIVAQYRVGDRVSGEPLNPAGDRLAIVVGEHTTGSIARDLKEALSRLATGSATAIPDQLLKPLEKLSGYLKTAWLRQFDEPMPAKALEEILALTRIVVVSPDSLRHARGLLRRNVAIGDADRILATFKLWAIEMAHRGTGGDRQALIDLIEREHGTFEGFGRTRNPNLGTEQAGQVFEALARDALATLEHAGLYRPSRTVRRDPFHDEISKFIAGPARVMPVVGVSGVGKTTALATLLGDADPALPPGLFVRCADIRPEDDGIRSLIERTLARAQPDHDPRQFLEGLLAASPQPALVILDALNEADAMSRSSLRHSWIPHSLDWLIRHNLRLVLSCRPEVWTLLADAFPADLLYFPAVAESDDKDAPPLAARQKEAFRLGDFSGSEAAEAVSLYGLSESLPPDQVRHPFLLAVAADLHSDGTDLDSGFGSAVGTFIRRRAARAAERLERPSWIEPMLTGLEAMAAAMFGQCAQSLENSQADNLFGARASAIEALIEENLLLRSEVGLRFQHDQVGEYLQAKQVAAAMIAGELSPGSGREKHKGRSKGFIKNLREAWCQLREYSVERRADLRGDRKLNPSIAAFALTRMLRVPGDPEAIRLLDGLFRSTHPHRTDRGFQWAAQTIQLLLDRVDPKTMCSEDVLGWLRTLLGREDAYYHSEWPRDIAAAAAGALVRADLPPEAKQAFVPLLARQELDTWGTREIRSKAFLETYNNDSSDWAPFAGHIEGTATGRLIDHLARTDIAGTVSALGVHLDYQGDFGRKNVRGYCHPSLASIAAISLYHFRASDIDQVCGEALHATSVWAADLVDSLAISNPAELARIAISRLPAAIAEDTERMRRAILLAAGHCPIGAGDEILAFAVRALCSSDPAEQIFGARTYLELYHNFYRYAVQVADPEEAAQLLDALSGARDLAIAILGGTVARGEQGITDDDYLRLLEEDFGFALEVLERQLHLEDGPGDEAITAALRFISRVNLKDGRDRLDRARRMMQWLHSYADARGSAAMDRLAEFVLDHVQHADQSIYYITKEQLYDLGMPKLARRVLQSASPGVMKEVAGRGWPFLEEMRELFFEEVNPLPLSEKNLECLVHNLFVRTSRDCENPFERIASLRGRGREEAWDRAARRYLWGSGARMRDELIAYWQNLPEDDHTYTSQIILSRIAEGMLPMDAAGRRFPKPQAGEMEHF